MKPIPIRYTEGSDSEELRYSPADSPVAMFGGNSNWRGPVWMPINFLLIESLQKFAHYYGDSFQVEFPTRSGNWINLWDASLQLQKPSGGHLPPRCRWPAPLQRGCGVVPARPPLAGSDRSSTNTSTVINGRGVGASHQTGWSAVVAKMINQLHRYPLG
jgi:hypothetical protein